MPTNSGKGFGIICLHRISLHYTNSKVLGLIFWDVHRANVVDIFAFHDIHVFLKVNRESKP